MITTDLIAIGHGAVDLGANIMRRRAIGTLTYKNDRDYATEADYVIEREMRKYLNEHAPRIGFLGEESGAFGSTDTYWALDPIDGTINYARSLPICGISLALIIKGIPTLGVVDLPYLGERYVGVLGEGATRNGDAIRVRMTRRLEDAVISVGDYATGPNARAKNADRLAVTRELAGTALRVRMIGSAATDLTWLAAGRTDAVVMLTNHPWDTAAGIVIAREAGAEVFDLHGRPHTIDSPETIAAAPLLKQELLRQLRRATQPYTKLD